MWLYCKYKFIFGFNKQKEFVCRRVTTKRDELRRHISTERKKESVSVREREGERGEGAKITQAAGTIQIEDLQRG